MAGEINLKTSLFHIFKSSQGFFIDSKNLDAQLNQV